LTQKGVERAHSALHDAEGHAEKLLNRTQSKIEKKAGLSGDGLYQAGNGMLLAGNGMFQAGRGSTFVTQPLVTTCCTVEPGKRLCCSWASTPEVQQPMTIPSMTTRCAIMRLSELGYFFGLILVIARAAAHQKKVVFRG
jgi:hypothetical protein